MCARACVCIFVCKFEKKIVFLFWNDFIIIIAVKQLYVSSYWKSHSICQSATCFSRTIMYFVCCQSLSRVRLCDPMYCSKPGFPVFHNLLEFAQIYITDSVMLSNHLILCHPLLLLSAIFPSIRVFSNELFLHIRYTYIPKCMLSLVSSKHYSAWMNFSSN